MDELFGGDSLHWTGLVNRSGEEGVERDGWGRAEGRRWAWTEAFALAARGGEMAGKESPLGDVG